MATLVVGDDQVVFLDALSDVIQRRGHTVAAVARDTPQMLAAVHRYQPDLCLIDRPRRRESDSQTIVAVRQSSGRTRVVMLGADWGGNELRQALEAGAAGYVHLSCGVDALIASLGRVLRGDVAVDMPGSVPRRPPEASPGVQLADRLTGRERQCLMMLVSGLDTAAMGQRLGVSRTTVRSHVHAVRTKLGVHSRLEAASFAVRHGLTDTWSASSSPRAAVSAR